MTDQTGTSQSVQPPVTAPPSMTGVPGVGQARPASGPSMTRRLIVWMTLVIAGLWFLAVGLGLVVMEEEYAEIFDGVLQDTAERLVPLVVDDLDQRGTADGSPQQLQTGSSSGDPEYLIYQVRDAQGRVLIRSHDAPDRPFETPLDPGFWKNDTYQFYTATDPKTHIVVQVADAFANREEALQQGAKALFLPLVLLIPVSGIAIWLIVRWSMRPVGDLRGEIESKDGGNTEPIDAGMLPRELQPIALSVNLLMARLRAALDAEREFTSNSAHELRTPIAGALAQTQMLIAELSEPTMAQPATRGPVAQHVVHHRAIQVESALKRLSRLAEKLLQLARAEAGIGVSEAPVDLGKVLDMVLTDFWRGMADPERLVLHRQEGATLMAPVSEDAFAIVIRNLIENALSHGMPESPVEVYLEPHTVRIVNAAPVMSADELLAIRRRFRRGQTTASGSGLGLSIVERLLGQMNGRLTLQSPARGRPDGFEASIEFSA